MLRSITAAATSVLLGACNTSQPIYDIATASVPASAETDPMVSIGDRADDPAIWVHPAAVGSSDNAALILGTNKEEGLYVYNLSGSELQFLPVGRLNNIDLRGNVAVGSNDEVEGLSWFEITPDTRATVHHLGDTPVEKVEPYGVCMAEEDDQYLAAATYKDGVVQIWSLEKPLADTVSAARIRTVQLPSQLEGCVFDEAHGRLFIGEEAFGIWSLSYRDSDAEPEIVDRIADRNGLVEDTEGLSIWKKGPGGYLVASAQAGDRFVVYDRNPPHTPRGVFTVVGTSDGLIDGVSHTDGLDVVSAPLPGYPAGLLVVQDDANPTAAVDQNFKLVDWKSIMSALKLDDE